MKREFRIVVIDDNEVTLGSFKKYFKSSREVLVVKAYRDGRAALNYLINYQEEYDMVVMDVILPNIDGFVLLEQLQRNGINKKIMVLSSFKDDFTIKKANELGADYYMLKPARMNVIEKRIIDLLEGKDEIQLAMEGKIELQINNILHDLGIPSHIRGYKYIKEGILILYNSDKLITLITKDVYPKIAVKFDTTKNRVERAIRNAIEISWMRGDIKVMESIFGNSVDFDRSRPTNAEFITAIADRIKLDKPEIIS